MPVSQMVIGYIVVLTGTLVLFLTALASLGIIKVLPVIEPAPKAATGDGNRWEAVKEALKEMVAKLSLPALIGLIILIAGMIMCGAFGSHSST